MINATDVGIRELKSNASEIVRNVRKRRTRYVITHRGEPVAQIGPVETTMPMLMQDMQASADDNWNELIRLGQLLALKKTKTSAAISSEMRR